MRVRTAVISTTPLPAHAETDGTIREPDPTRSCGSCSLCCKVMSVNELEKPADRWCPHAKPGVLHACRIYADRPHGCRVFHCLWRLGIGRPEDRPDKTHLVLVPGMEQGRQGLMVHADPGTFASLRDIVQSSMGRHLFVLLENEVRTTGVATMWLVIRLRQHRWLLEWRDDRVQVVQQDSLGYAPQTNFLPPGETP